MGEDLKQFLATLRYAVWTRQSIHIAGSDFSPAEVARIVENLETLITKEVK